jgi:hypothetical protein
MIDIRELNKGNLIYDKNGKIIEVTGTQEWDCDGDIINIDFCQGDITFTKCCDIFPIPLSEYALVTLLGFAKGDCDEYFKRFWLPSGFGVCEAVYSDNYVKEGLFYVEDFRSINSVHMLQNQYFFNFGKELKIKI